jgi:hypothetical protein
MNGSLHDLVSPQELPSGFGNPESRDGHVGPPDLLCDDTEHAERPDPVLVEARVE